MNLKVNGETSAIQAGATVAQLLERFELRAQQVAVEVNEELVPRRDFDRVVLQDGDNVEIVTLVGGG